MLRILFLTQSFLRRKRKIRERHGQGPATLAGNGVTHSDPYPSFLQQHRLRAHKDGFQKPEICKKASKGNLPHKNTI